MLKGILKGSILALLDVSNAHIFVVTGDVTEMALLAHMIKEIKGWSCSVCGYHSTSTASRSHVKRHVETHHSELL